MKQTNTLDAYMDDYQRQTTALSNQVRDMEKEKMKLVQQVEDRLEEGSKANELLSRKIVEANETRDALQKAARKNFRDFEGEMEDYEPVEEENSDAEQSVADVVDSAQLPVKPAFGQIDYYRQVNGDDQHWMQQITPRAGGDSMLGQHDLQDDPEIAMEKNQTAHYDVASVPPSRYNDEVEQAGVEAEYQEVSAEMEAEKSEEF